MTNSISKLHKNTLTKEAFDLLMYISNCPEYQHFYLAGGTALALQIGHRQSIDLDFFSDQFFKSNLIDSLDKNYQILSRHDNSIEIICDNTKTFFFYFGFPLTKKMPNYKPIRLAHPVDIGLMKLLALQGRTTKKDVIDLYFIDKEVIKLEELLQIFEKEYPKDSFNSYDSLKTLIDLDSIETEPIPIMIKEFNWQEAKQLIERKIGEHIKQVIN